MKDRDGIIEEMKRWDSLSEEQKEDELKPIREELKKTGWIKEDINKNFERISQLLRDEDITMTPQEISKWTGIDLDCVYYTLQNNKVYFVEIIKDEALIGWTVAQRW